jgi:hypothetical protein
MSDIHENNARHAREHAAVPKEAVLATLHENGASVLALLRGFRDEQMETLAGNFGGNDLTIAQVIERIVIGHGMEHFTSISATLAA